MEYAHAQRVLAMMMVNKRGRLSARTVAEVADGSDFAVVDQLLQIAVNSCQRERRHLGQHRFLHFLRNRWPADDINDRADGTALAGRAILGEG